jgi:hypothetical protein
MLREGSGMRTGERRKWADSCILGNDRGEGKYL